MIFLKLFREFSLKIPKNQINLFYFLIHQLNTKFKTNLINKYLLKHPSLSQNHNFQTQTQINHFS